jgi:hypothetical protein
VVGTALGTKKLNESLVRVRIGCLQFAQKLNGKSRTTHPGFDQRVSIFQPFLHQKTNTKINNHLGLSMFDMYSKNPYKTKKKPTSTSMNWGVQHSYFQAVKP